MAQRKKIGLVLTGGGMRCAYSAGALQALVEVYGLHTPYALGAESGSAGNAFYYLARQYNVSKHMWTDLLVSKKFISSRKSIDIDYLIDTLFKKKVPLDTKTLSKTKTKFFVPVTDTASGDITFISNNSYFDYFETLRAAKALPIVYGKKVRLGLKRYIDGGMTSNIENLARTVLATGVTHLITINCEPQRRDTLSKLFLSAKAFSSPTPLRRAMLRDLAVPPGLCPTAAEVRAYCIQPSRALKVGTLSNARNDLIDTYNLGYADVAGSPELKKLFQHSVRRIHPHERRRK